MTIITFLVAYSLSKRLAVLQPVSVQYLCCLLCPDEQFSLIVFYCVFLSHQKILNAHNMCEKFIAVSVCILLCISCVSLCSGMYD